MAPAELISSEIIINNLTFEAYLGWSEHERAKPRRVEITISLKFPYIPQAVHSDDLAETLCYQEIEDRLSHCIQQQTFRLIEHLAYRCYENIQDLLPQNAHCSISVTKYLEGSRGSRTFVLRSGE
jgi:dihydroneopterin aldolase